MNNGLREQKTGVYITIKEVKRDLILDGGIR